MRWVAAALCFAFLCSAARGDELTPLVYDLTIVPHVEEGTFSGTATIDLHLDHAHRSLRLQARGLAVREAAVQTATGRRAAAISVEDDAVVLHLERPLQPGRATVVLSWTGALSTHGRGLYVARIDGRPYLFTQLEPDSAHAVFPCLDAPAMRARFRVRAIVPSEDQVIGNGELLSERPGARPDTKLVELSETPPISPHVFALAIGQFDRRRALSGQVPVSVAAPLGRGGEAGDALAAVVDLLPRLERYLGTPYPFAKLDLVAAPGLPPRAMENAAAIFVRSDELLLGPDASLPRRQGMVRLVAHELAHQWFGDLVAVSSWHDLWLAEGLARWLEFDVLDEAHPDWKAWSWFHPMRDRMLAVDARATTHAIGDAAPAWRPAFDYVTYDKGAATMRMLERWIGRDRLRLALQRFLRGHAFGVAHTSDLWRALATVSDEPSVELARSWIEQRGFPEITVRARCVGDTLDLGIAQHPAARYERRRHLRWEVPLELRAASTPLRLLLRSDTAHVHLHDPAGCPTQIGSTDDDTVPFRVHVIAESTTRAR